MTTPHNPNQDASTQAQKTTQSPSNPPPAPGTSSRDLGVPPSGGTTLGGPIGKYDFAWLVTQLEKHGQRQFGLHFKIRPEDHDILYRLLVYFLADKPLANKLGIDLDKGIALTGPIGCGKTSLMRLMKLVALPERNFTIKPTRNVTFEFIEDGYKVIHRYSDLSFTDHGPKTYCFDDLGAERALKYFGNECNVLAEVILSRYDYYTHSHMLTHITTNLSATELEDSYGPRVRSRLREMFNLYSFPYPSPDKRK